MAEVTMVPVREILRRVTRSVDILPEDHDRDADLFWPTLIGWKIQDSQILQLVDAISAEGFTVPVAIVRHADGTWEQENGHHRVVVAILLALDEIPVRFYEPGGPGNIYRETVGGSLPRLSDPSDATWLATEVTIR